jgi:hypothetical protein
MRTCSYCGATYGDDVLVCPADQTSLVPPTSQAPGVITPRGAHVGSHQFSPLSPKDRQQALVTLLRCQNLSAADLVVARLRAAGIEAFIPDQTAVQVIGLNYGLDYVRIQVSPDDYDAACALLAS